jgi:hypothetical protein
LAHLPILILASFSLTTVADTVPKFDIAKECRAEGGAQAVLERCVADESKARDELQPLWIQFNHHDKAVCLTETSMDGTPSYVESCARLARDRSCGIRKVSGVRWRQVL